MVTAHQNQFRLQLCRGLEIKEVCPSARPTRSFLGHMGSCLGMKPDGGWTAFDFLGFHGSLILGFR